MTRFSVVFLLIALITATTHAQNSKCAEMLQAVNDELKAAFLHELAPIDDDNAMQAQLRTQRALTAVTGAQTTLALMRDSKCRMPTTAVTARTYKPVYDACMVREVGTEKNWNVIRAGDKTCRAEVTNSSSFVK